MTRLSAMDAVWMDMDTDGPPIAVGGLVVLEGPVPTLEEYRAFVATRVSGRLREKLTPSTLRVRQATWEPADPDLSTQIRELRVPEPGGQAELEAAVAEILGIPMDPDLPLWDSTMITGLEGGTWALLTRLHHVVADGQGGLLLTGQMIDVDPDGGKTLTEALDERVRAIHKSRAAGEDTETSSPPARVVIAAQEGGDYILRALRTITSQSATQEALRSVSESVSKTIEAINAQLPGKPGPLTGDPGVERTWSTTQVSLNDVRTIRQSLGGTVNDVVMTLMAGGYDRALASMGEKAESIRVAIPLSLRVPGDLRANNQVSALLVVLPLGGHAAARLADVKEHIDTIKDLGIASVGVPVQALVDATVPAFVQTFAVANLTGPLGRTLIDSLVTNVPGPPFPIYVFGRRVRTLAPVLPMGASLRLSAAIFSYDGVLQFGITGGEGMEDAVHAVVEGIQATLAELLESAGSA